MDNSPSSVVVKGCQRLSFFSSPFIAEEAVVKYDRTKQKTKRLFLIPGLTSALLSLAYRSLLKVHSRIL